MILEGLKVLSFCHYLQGPSAMQYLADMGADVIKIEPPRGAFERHWGGAQTARVGGVSAFYLCANRNVRSLAVDLKHPESADVIMRLVDTSHAIAENFRPGTLDRLGFGYEAVRARKPDIIYASASGFGADGPYAKRPGQDLLVQAMSGLASVGGDGRTPAPVGFTAADQHGAALFALAIAGAYARWLRSGEGTRVESTLLGAALDLQAESLVTYYASELGLRAFQRDARLGTWFHDAPYGVYPTSDGHIAVSMNALPVLAEALDSDALRAFSEADAYEKRNAVAEATAAAVAGRSFEDIAAAFDRHGLWYARIEGYDDLRDNPQVVHNGAFQQVAVNGDDVTLVAHPVRYDGDVPGVRSIALTPGADTRAVLEQVGFSSTELADLIRNRVVFTGEAA